MPTSATWMKPELSASKTLKASLISSSVVAIDPSLVEMTFCLLEEATERVPFLEKEVTRQQIGAASALGQA